MNSLNRDPQRPTRADLRRFLVRQSKMYPGGIAVDLLAQETGPRVLFLLGEPLNEETRALLLAAVEKGMKLPLSAVVWREQIQEDLRSPNVMQSLAAVVQCGDCSPHSVAEGCPVYRTYGLSEILADAGKKRDFWSVLKQVMARLNDEGER